MPTVKNSPARIAAARTLNLTRVVAAPRGLVFPLWTDPQHVAQWWGPHGFTNPVCQLDARPGGAIRIDMRGPDGTVYPMTGRYRDIVEPERLVFTSAALDAADQPLFEVLTTVTFTEEGGETTLRLEAHVVEATAAADPYLTGMAAGWTQSLEKLGEHLARIPVLVERTFDAPMDVVWRALTDVDQMKQWYIPNIESFKPEVGFRTEFNVREGGKDYLHQWEITTVVPGSKIACRWKFDGYPGDSLVTFELSPESGKTKLKLTHEGLESFRPVDNPDLARGAFAEGWTNLIGTALKEFVERLGAAAGREFVFTRVFDAPRAAVWRAWTEAEQLQRWFGPKGCTVPACSLDLRPGGLFHYCMRTPDGHVMWGKWTFVEIEPLEKLVVIVSFSDSQGGVSRHPMSPTWPLETLSTMTLTERAGKTELTLRWAPSNATESERQTFDASHEGMQQGWTGTMDQLAVYLAKG